MVEVVTFGCRINSYESEVLKEKLAALDNVVIVNTCAVTGEAERQCRQAIRKLRRENPDAADEPEPEQTLIRELPDQYADINSSGLDQTIPAEGNKNLELALEGEVDATPRPMNSGRGAGPGMR